MIARRRWLALGLVLCLGAALWLTQGWWLPLLPQWLGQALDWSKDWGNAVQTLADLLAILAGIAGLVTLVLVWLGFRSKREAANEREREPSAPLRNRPVDVIMDEKLAGGARIRWVDRSATDDGDLLRTPRLILTGASRIGKTREALELIRRAVAKDTVTAQRVYEPNYQDLRFLTGDGLETALRRNMAPDTAVLLFVDDFPYHFAAASEWERLEAVLSVLGGCKESYVLMTGRSDQMTPAHATWLAKHEFTVSSLDKLDERAMREFIYNTCTVLSLSTDEDATALLVSLSDGVPELARRILLRVQEKGVSQASRDDIFACGGTTVQDLWAKTRREIEEREPAARYVLDALATFHAARVRTYPSMVLAYAAALWRQPVWRKRRKLGAALRFLDQYEIRVVDGLIGYPDQIGGGASDADTAREALGRFLTRYRRWAQNRLLRRFNGKQAAQRWALFDLAMQTTAERKPDTAVGLYSAGINVSPHFWLYINRGNLRNDQGDVAGALSDFNQAIAFNPQDATAYYNRGNLWRSQGDVARALSDYDQAISLNPQYFAPYNNRGNLRGDQGDVAGALSDFNQAIALEPQDATAYNNRGNLRCTQGDIAGALNDYERAIALDPQAATAYNNRGLLRSDQGDVAGALSDFDRAILFNPQYANAYNNRGFMRLARGDMAGALSDYDQAIALNPQYARAYHDRGFLRSAQGDVAGALSDYDQAIALSADIGVKARAYGSLGTALRQIGRWAEAEAAHREATELAPERAINWAALGDALRRCGDAASSNAAIDTGRQYLDEDDLYDAACFESIAGNTDRALELLDQALAQGAVPVFWVVQDPELAYIRDDERFDKIIRCYQDGTSG